MFAAVILRLTAKSIVVPASAIECYLDDGYCTSLEINGQSKNHSSEEILAYREILSSH